MYVMGSFFSNECEVLETTTPTTSFQPIATRPHRQNDPAMRVLNTDVYLLGNIFDKKKQVQKYST